MKRSKLGRQESAQEGERCRPREKGSKKRGNIVVFKGFYDLEKDELEKYWQAFLF